MNKKFLLIILIAIIIIGVAIIFIGESKNNNQVVENVKKEEASKVQTTSKNTNNESTNANKEKKGNEITDSEKKNKEGDDKDMYSKGLHHATIEVKNYGKIKLELNADVAPITVSNFAKLVNSGFYDGLTFHRIMDGFMIQGGDPKGNGTGGSSEEIKGEFKANGVENNISHVRGVISMARATPYNSASSQFFIVQKDSLFLDGKYAGFGKVLEGIEIVDKICMDTQVEDDNGTVLKKNQPIIEKIIMED